MKGWRYYTDAGVIEIALENVKEHRYDSDDIYHNETHFEMKDGSAHTINLDKTSYCFFGDLSDYPSTGE